MHIKTEIIINATPEKVWEKLIGFENYRYWNPFIESVEGKPVPGEKLAVVIRPPGGSVMKFNPVVLEAEKEKKLSWKGKVLFSGLFDGIHVFEIQKISEKEVRFIQSEVFSGILVRLLASTLNKTKIGFETMNAALKTLAES